MLKKIINILWTYSPQDYWIKLWSKTTIDEKAIAAVKETKKRAKVVKSELKDVAKAVKEVGNQVADSGSAVKGNARKGRKKSIK